MTSSAVILRNYKAAISLNNIGVLLLEQGDLRQALETLKDAILAMKHSFPSSRSLLDSSNEINAKLQRAMKRLVPPGTSSSSLPFTVDAIYYEEGSVSMFKKCLQYGPTSPFLFPIKIACSDFEYPEDKGIDLKSAILLYNFGLVHCCAAGGDNVCKAQERALKLLRLSETILVQQSTSCDQLDEQTNILHIAAMVLSTTVRVLVQQGKVHEANEAHRKLQLVGDMVNEMEQSDTLRGMDVRAAAAA